MLRYLADDIESGAVDVVLIHDAPSAGRPRHVRHRALAVAREFGGAIPALTVPDVVQQGPSGIRVDQRQRQIGACANPQAFRAKPLLRAYRAAARGGFEGTDTSSCIEKYTAEQVRTFSGDEANLKVTYAHDVAVAGRLLSLR